MKTVNRYVWFCWGHLFVELVSALITPMDTPLPALEPEQVAFGAVRAPDMLIYELVYICICIYIWQYLVC